MHKLIRLLCKILKIQPVSPLQDSENNKTLRPSYSFLLYNIAREILKRIPSILFTNVFILIFLLKAFPQNQLIALSFFSILFGFLLLYYLSSILFSILYIYLDYIMRFYTITDNYVRIREGVFTLRETTITISKIQSITISQGPLQEIFDIADIRLETAGKQSSQLDPTQTEAEENVLKPDKAFIKGISNYEDVKLHIMNTLKKYKDSGIGPQDYSTISTSKHRKLNPLRKTLLCEIRNEIHLISHHLTNQNIANFLK